MVPRLLNYVILTPYFTYIVFKKDMGEYGKLTELYAYVSFLLILLTYGMETAYFRFINSNLDKSRVYSTIVTSLFVTSISFLILVFFSLNFISCALDYSGEKYFLLYIASIVSIEAFTVIPFAKLRVLEKAKKFAILKGINVVLNILLVIFFYNILPAIGLKHLILNSAGNVSVKFVLLANLITSFTILIIILPELKEYSFRKFNIKLWTKILNFGWPLLIAGFAGTINETLDRGILKQLIPDKIKGLHDLAVYGANYKIAAFILLFIQMYRFAIEPFFFNYAKNKDSKEQYARLMNLFVGLTTFMGVAILVFIDYIKYFIDPVYHAGLNIVPYIIVAYIFSGIYYNHSIWFKLSDKTVYAIYIASIGAFATIILNVLFVPTYSYYASAVATTISYGLMVLFSFIFSYKFYYIKYNLSRMCNYFFIGGLLIIASKFIFSHILIINLTLKTLIVLFFAIFVIWKEKLFKFFSIYGNKNS